jgi:hypothetical protein
MGLALALACLIALSLPAAASAARSAYVTRGLDYLHSRQSASGGFQDPVFTPWVVLAIAAGPERVTSSAWSISGKNPFSYMETLNHPNVASGGAQSNVPAYYAKTIMAYVAAGRRDRVPYAGSPDVDLLLKLYEYRFEDGHFSRARSNPNDASVSTTIWAVLALRAARVTGPELDMAVAWLQQQQKSDGGFPGDPSLASDIADTAGAIQALLAGGVSASDDTVQDALAFMRAQQRSDGGFPDRAGGSRTYAGSTAWAIQAILATGGDPGSATWSKNGNTPVEALRGLQTASGAFQHRKGTLSAPLVTTPHAVIALSGASGLRTSFDVFPRSRPRAVEAFAFRPWVRDVKPADKARFTTSAVTISAKYGDNDDRGSAGIERGTGIDTKAIRIFVDGKDRTKSAGVSSSGVSLKLTGISNGTHSWELRIADKAGNASRRTRSFTVSVSTPAGTRTPTPIQTYRPATPTFTPTSRPTPTTTLFPTPSPSATAAPTPPTPGVAEAGPVTGVPVGPSVSGSPLPSAMPAASSDDGGGAGLVGGTILAALPAGAVLSYLAMRRREAAIAAAGEGRILPGCGTAWQRLAAHFRRGSGV